MTDTTPERPPRATRAEIDRLTEDAERLQRELVAARLDLDDLRDRHARELAHQRRKLARMVVPCGVTLDDLVAVAGER